MTQELLIKGNKQIDSIIDQMDVSHFAKLMAKYAYRLGGDPSKILLKAYETEKTEQAEALHPKKALPKDYTEVEKIIHELLIENTGVCIVDSGGVYGRNWERNRSIRDFRKTPEVIIYKGVWGYAKTNIFHYLRYFLERDGLSKLVENVLYRYMESRTGRLTDKILAFCDEALNPAGFRTIPFNTADVEPYYVSQDMQGVYFAKGECSEEPAYLILQIHNGCDLRWGYTMPRVFKVVEDSKYDFFTMMSELLVKCKCGLFTLPNERLKIDWDEGRQAFFCGKCGKKARFYPPYYC
jgi:hypothetical protein